MEKEIKELEKAIQLNFSLLQNLAQTQMASPRGKHYPTFPDGSSATPLYRPLEGRTATARTLLPATDGEPSQYYNNAPAATLK